MPARSRKFARSGRAIAALACLLVLTGWRFGPEVTFFEDESGIAKAVEALRAAGGLERALSISITEMQVRIEAQDPGRVQHVNKWVRERHRIGSFYWDATSGPDPVELNLIDKDLDANLFNFSAVDFTAARKVIREAITRAALEDPARVASIEIRRQLYLLPDPSSGDVFWNVSVTSGRESALVQADAKGNIVRVDLAGTNRAKAFNLLASLEMLPDAAQAFRSSVGDGPVLIKASVSPRGLSFETNLEEKSALFTSLKQRQAYQWSLNGLNRVMGSIDTSEHFGADPPFAVGETDWTLAEGLVRKARDTLGMPNAKLAEIELSKPKDRAGPPQLEWEITLEENREQGVALFDAKGESLGHTLPKSRQKPFDGRDPAAWPAALSLISGSFGGDGAIAEVIIHDKHMSISALDPQNPKQLGEFLLDEDGIKRFGTVSPFTEANPRFSVADLKALDAAQMRKLQEATAQRLGLPTSKITTITIGRASLDPSPQGRVTVEIRAEEAPFGRGGRVNWEIDGREIKAYLP
jgi:hypothetical protein